jgi:hypothetical protein
MERRRRRSRRRIGLSVFSVVFSVGLIRIK